VNATFLALPHSLSIIPFSLFSSLSHSSQFRTPFPSNPSVSIPNVDSLLFFLCGFSELFAMVGGLGVGSKKLKSLVELGSP